MEPFGDNTEETSQERPTRFGVKGGTGHPCHSVPWDLSSVSRKQLSVGEFMSSQMTLDVCASLRKLSLMLVKTALK